MKALVCDHVGSFAGLNYRDMPDAEPRPDEVVVRVAAAGLLFTDTLLALGHYQERPELPFIMGNEVSGQIIKLGSAVRHLKIGDRVASVSDRFSCFAEQVALPAWLPARLPAKVPDTIAAALMSSYGTAQHALRQRAQLRSGETLVVTGAAGGTGAAAVQVGRAMGARVIAICSTAEKAAFARKQGADDTVVAAPSDLREALRIATAGKGADVVFDTVGGEVFEACARTMAFDGRMLIVGFASGAIPALRMNRPLVGGYSVIGVHWTSYAARHREVHADNMLQLMDWLERGSIQPPVDSILPMSMAATALQKIADRKVMGKIVLVPDGAHPPPLQGEPVFRRG